MNLTVIVPVFNEEKTLELSLRRLLKVDVVKQIICVNDCSNDKSLEIVDGCNFNLIQYVPLLIPKLLLSGNFKNSEFIT